MFTDVSRVLRARSSLRKMLCESAEKRSMWVKTAKSAEGKSRSCSGEDELLSELL